MPKGPGLTDKQIRQRLLNEIKTYFALRRPRRVKLPSFLSAFRVNKTNDEKDLIRNIMAYASQAKREHPNMRADLHRIISELLHKGDSVGETELKKVIEHLESYFNIDEKKVVLHIISLLEQFFSITNKHHRSQLLKDIEQFVDNIIYNEKTEPSY